MDLHDVQRRGTVTQTQLGALYPQMKEAESKIDAASDVPAGVKSQFDALMKELAVVDVKFGIGPSGDASPAAAGGRGGRGGGGRGAGGRAGGAGGRAGGAAADADLVTRVATVKAAIGGIWELPSDVMMKRYTEAKAALPPAIGEANAAIAKANAMAPTLKRYGVELNSGK
jgi:hypothetical protein